MKTAVFFLSPSCGGAERMTITIAKLLDRSEYDVRFVVIGCQIGEIKEFIPEGYPISLIKIRKIYEFVTLRIYRLLQDIHPQYVFCSLHYLNPRVICAAKILGNCKVIVRQNCAISRLRKLDRFLAQKTYPLADVIIAQTKQMKKDLETEFKLNKDKVISLHNLIDKETIEKELKEAVNPYEKEKNKVYVWVGRFDPVKGADIAIKAFIEANRQNHNISLYLVGKINEQNSYYQKVRFIANSSECRDNIHFVGFQENPYRWMKYADCFVLSSRSEGSPNALFEAIFIGIPSIATRCTPNIDEIVKDGENGFLVNINDVEGMSDCMLKAFLLKEVKTVYNHSTPNDFRCLFS